MRLLLPVLVTSIMFGCGGGGGDDNKQLNDKDTNTTTAQNTQNNEQSDNTNLNENTPSVPTPGASLVPNGHHPAPSETSNDSQPQPSTPVVPQPSNTDTQVSAGTAEKIDAAFDLFVSPKNYEANSYLKAYESIDFKKTKISLQDTADLVLKCSWMIKEQKVSDSCNYQLTGDDHLHPIKITAYLQNTKGQKTESSDTIIQKAFPVTHRKTLSGDAMLMTDGRIISWNAPSGSNLNEARTKLLPADAVDSRRFVSLSANKSAFVALDKDGKIVTWGNRKQGGDAPDFVTSKKIKQIAASDYAFTALSEDGKVYLWGNLSEFKPGEEIAISGHVTTLYGLSKGFIALTDDGNAYGFGVDIPLTSKAVGSIKKAISTQVSHGSIYHKYSMAVLNNTGNVYVWGGYADNLPELDSVVDLTSNNEAYAALKKNGDVVVWGDPAHGGEFKYSLHKREYINGRFTKDTTWTAIQPPKNVTKVVASDGAFAALQKDGKAVTWGEGFSGGNTYSVEPDNEIQNKTITDIHGNEGGFIGIDSNGNMTTWGYWWITDENLVNYDAGENPDWQSNLYNAIGKGAYKNFTSNSASFAFSISNKNTSEFFAVGRKEIGGRILRGNFRDIKGEVTKIIPHECGYSAFSSTGDVYGWFGCDDDPLYDGTLNKEYEAKPYEIVK
ncbi:hypothetical protein [Aeromonas hydrophila]|uniref:hypothetical protein n=1 Tax=Aeromonas hydrophila TaxID=644 RepID=UPI003D1D8820